MHGVAALVNTLVRALQRLLRPARSTAHLFIGAARDLPRTRSELLAENAMLRQQLIVLRRAIGRPRIHDDDRHRTSSIATETRRVAKSEDRRGNSRIVCSGRSSSRAVDLRKNVLAII